MQTWTKLHIALNNMWHICSTNKGNKKCVLEYCYFYCCFNVCLLLLLLFLFLWFLCLSGDWIMFSRTLKYGSEDLAALLVRTFKAFHSLLNVQWTWPSFPRCNKLPVRPNCIDHDTIPVSELVIPQTNFLLSFRFLIIHTYIFS